MHNNDNLYGADMKISFCTTCMDRAKHLKETLPENILNNPPAEGLDVEFVVLNYNTTKDNLHEWILNDPEMKKHIESGLVRYARTTDPENFHMAHAKNMAHRLATGDVLCNLDADNFLGKGFAEMLQRHFSDNMDIVMNPSHKIYKIFSPDEGGVFGRIAISRDNFYAINGYDETFTEWGGEDDDLMRRAKALGAKHIKFENLNYMKVIAHTNEERIINMVQKAKGKQHLQESKKRKAGMYLYPENYSIN